MTPSGKQTEDACKALKKTVDDLKTRKAKLEAASGTVAADVTKLKADCDRLEGENEKLRAQTKAPAAEPLEEVRKACEDFEETNKVWVATKTEHETQLRNVQGSIASLEGDCADLRQEIERLKRQRPKVKVVEVED